MNEFHLLSTAVTWPEMFDYPSATFWPLWHDGGRIHSTEVGPQTPLPRGTRGASGHRETASNLAGGLEWTQARVPSSDRVSKRSVDRHWEPWFSLSSIETAQPILPESISLRASRFYLKNGYRFGLKPHFSFHEMVQIFPHFVAISLHAHSRKYIDALDHCCSSQILFWRESFVFGNVP